VLQAEQVAVFRAERLVFRDVNLRVDPGGALLLIGPNGSGKSTLLRLLAGLLLPEAGRVLWNGEDALVDLPLHAGRVCYLGHQDAVKTGLTLAENLYFPAAVARSSSQGLSPPPEHSDSSIKAALGMLALSELTDLPARMLSAGQRRRLALARFALSSAPLWLLDEPTVGLDTDSIERVAAIFAGHRARGGIIVTATHVAMPLPHASELHLA